ncbi:MAG: hypothetical protein ACFFB5_20730 [Promethearchaeota archaeon]
MVLILMLFICLVVCGLSQELPFTPEDQKNFLSWVILGTDKYHL